MSDNGVTNYGVTDKGFVLKRMDKILEEIHADLTKGFGVDTRLDEASFLNVLVTTFAGQIAELWEQAQDSYYAKYPATAGGINLDNAVQYGGIRRMPNRQSCYPLHCTGTDGTAVRQGITVASDTNPEVRLFSAEPFTITRSNFNKVSVRVAVLQANEVYTVSINGEQYSYSSGKNDGALDVLNGIATLLQNSEYTTEVIEDDELLQIDDSIAARNNVLILSDNLTTEKVTTIANFFTEEYGRVTLPDKIVTKMINNVSGFDSVINLLEPSYGRLRENDIELRQSYLAKSAIRSNTMIESIVSEILNNVPYVESASGYENDRDYTDSRGLPPHSIEIVVEGGDDNEIADAILRRKAGGIATFGDVLVTVPGKYGDALPIRFNRPDRLYAWMKVVLYGRLSDIPPNYVVLVKNAITEYAQGMSAGVNLLTQRINEGIYDVVAGINYIDIYTAYTTAKGDIPDESSYKLSNIMATTRQKIMIDEARIEVTVDESIR